jgi:hypothetical protein
MLVIHRFRTEEQSKGVQPHLTSNRAIEQGVLVKHRIAEDIAMTAR